MSIAEINIYWKMDGPTCHLLRCGVNAKGEVFVHFISRERGSVQTSDPLVESMPDHVSYHKDGTIHIKHKDGHRTRYSISFKTGLLEKPRSERVMFFAASYYKEHFDTYRELLKAPIDERAEERKGVFVIKPTDSFTVLLYLDATPEDRADDRSIVAACFPGTLPLEEPNEIFGLQETSNVAPLLNCRPMPTWDLIEPLATSTRYPSFSI